MKPVVTDPNTTFMQLIDGLEVIDNEEKVRNQINQIIAKLQRKKRKMSSEMMSHFTDMTGGLEPTQYIR